MSVEMKEQAFYSHSNLKESIDRYNLWKGFWQLADPRIWAASLTSIVLGTALSITVGNNFNLLYGVVAVSVIILIEIGKNACNEYFDYLSGADQYVEPQNRTNFSGGKKVIVDGLLSTGHVALISVVCLVSAVILGLTLLTYRPGVIWFGIAGVFLAIAYSMPPFQLSYRGLGEIAVGLAFGPLIVNGTFYLHTGEFHLAPVLLSVPLGLLIANVLWINEIPDVEADQKAGKWNLVARRGRTKAIKGYVVLFIAAYLSILIAAIALKNVFYVISVATVFLAIPAIKCAAIHRHNTQALVQANSLTIQVYLLTGVLLSLASFF